MPVFNFQQTSDVESCESCGKLEEEVRVLKSKLQDKVQILKEMNSSNLYF